MKLYDTVKDILEKEPPTRNSDKVLLWRVWEELGYVKFNTLTDTDFIHAPTPESITRCRRKLQEMFEHLQANELVQEGRRQKEKEKGTHIYREKALRGKGHWEFDENGNADWVIE